MDSTVRANLPYPGKVEPQQRYVAVEANIRGTTMSKPLAIQSLVRTRSNELKLRPTDLFEKLAKKMSRRVCVGSTS
jgi:hypothetical protein